MPRKKMAKLTPYAKRVLEEREEEAYRLALRARATPSLRRVMGGRYTATGAALSAQTAAARARTAKAEAEISRRSAELASISAERARKRAAAARGRVRRRK